jgi:hypothetical protein
LPKPRLTSNSQTCQSPGGGNWFGLAIADQEASSALASCTAKELAILGSLIAPIGKRRRIRARRRVVDHIRRLISWGYRDRSRRVLVRRRCRAGTRMLDLPGFSRTRIPDVLPLPDQFRSVPGSFQRADRASLRRPSSHRRSIVRRAAYWRRKECFFWFLAQFSRAFGRREFFSRRQQDYRCRRFRVLHKREFWGEGDLWEITDEEISRTAIYTKSRASHVIKIGLVETRVSLPRLAARQEASRFMSVRV